MDFNEIVNDLIEGTDFEISRESQVLTSCELRVKTPIEALNILLGGGLPLNGVYHTYGEPKGGKSTWLYQTMGLFQEQYPDGIAAVLDMESSLDPEHLKSLGVQVDRVLRLPATSIESGFLALFKMLENKKKNKKIKDVPLFIIWDTISRGKAQDSTVQSRMMAQDRARIIKNYMPDLESRIEDQPFFLGLINQIIYEADRYGNQHIKAGGGVALQHENHMSMLIKAKSEGFDDTGNFITHKWSEMDVDKSKISPELRFIPFKIEVTKGGKINSIESFAWFMCYNMKKIVDVGSGYYKFDRLLNDYEDGSLIKRYILDNHDKKFRYKVIMDTIEADDLLYDILKYNYAEYITNVFSLQANIIREYKEELYASIMSRLFSIYPDALPQVESTSEEVSTKESTEEEVAPESDE